MHIKKNKSIKNNIKHTDIYILSDIIWSRSNQLSAQITSSALNDMLKY